MSVIDQPDAHEVTNFELPGDVVVLESAGLVTQRPQNLIGGGQPIHHGHGATPLDRIEKQRVALQQLHQCRSQSLIFHAQHQCKIWGANKMRSVTCDVAHNVTIAAQRGELPTIHRAGLLRCHGHQSERVRFREKGAARMIDRLHLVE
jgi:hypothetical protein